MCVCMIMLFLCVNVCMYFNESFVILYLLLYKGSSGRQQLLSCSFNFPILTFIWIYHYVNLPYKIISCSFSVWKLKINSLFYSIFYIYSFSWRHDELLLYITSYRMWQTYNISHCYKLCTIYYGITGLNVSQIKEVPRATTYLASAPYLVLVFDLAKIMGTLAIYQAYTEKPS